MKDKNNECSVTIIVVTYNRKELLKEALTALGSQSYKNVKVLVVDNCSTDGTKDYIKDVLKDNRFVYLNTGSNLGGAGGFNYGMKEAVKLGSDYIWVMDDDCIVHEDSLEKLLKFAKEKNDDFGYLSSVVRWKDGSICKMNHQKLSLKDKVSDFEVNGQQIMLASFVSMFIRREVVEDVGLPIKDFFIWGDDWEYTGRVSKKYPCYLVTDSVVTHKSNTNIGADISKDTSDRLDRYFYAYRNEGYFYKQMGFKGKVYWFLKKILHIKRILLSKGSNKFKKLKIMKKGLKALKTFNPKVEYVYGPSSEVNVLEFFGEPLLYGGQEAFIINMYKNFENKNIHYTFCTPFESENKTLIQMADKRGDKIVSYGYKFDSKLRKASIKKAAKHILSQEKFDVIHIHTGSVFTLIEVSKLAKKYGVKKVIAHSHATGYNTFKYRLIKKYSDKRILKYVNEYFACSDLAAAWKFPKNIIDEKKYYVIKNGIETEGYKFDKKVRDKYRKELGLNDSYVLCGVGRFSEPKNQIFTVELVEKLLSDGQDVKCVFVGAGETKNQIIAEVKNRKLEENFVFLENRTDVAEILMASDVFVFPSKFEGLGIVAIESQASGLPTLCSEYIPAETKITDIISYHELSNMNDWIDAIDKLKKKEINREVYAGKVAEAGYDASESALYLEDKYLGLL